MKPRFSQVAASTPFNDTDTSLGISSTQEALEDTLWMHKNYLPVRERDYYIPAGYQYKVYDCARLDHNMIIDGWEVIFG